MPTFLGYAIRFSVARDIAMSREWEADIAEEIYTGGGRKHQVGFRVIGVDASRLALFVDSSPLGNLAPIGYFWIVAAYIVYAAVSEWTILLLDGEKGKRRRKKQTCAGDPRRHPPPPWTLASHGGTNETCTTPSSWVPATHPLVDSISAEINGWFLQHWPFPDGEARKKFVDAARASLASPVYTSHSREMTVLPIPASS